MLQEIEDVLQKSGLRYTKNVDSAGQTDFALPFDLANGTTLVRLFTTEESLVAYAFVHALDTVAAPKKPLLLELLKLNGGTNYARVFVWTSSEELDWVAIKASVPLAQLTPDVAGRAIRETAHLTDQVLQIISACSMDSPKQLT